METDEVGPIAKVFSIATQRFRDQFDVVQHNAAGRAQCQTEGVSIFLADVGERHKRIVVLGQEAQVAEYGPRNRTRCLTDLRERSHLSDGLLGPVHRQGLAEVAHLGRVHLPRPVGEHF